MRYSELAALWYALSLSCIISFSVSSNQAHCLWFPQVGQETAPMGVNGCCHGSFSIYLLVTYLSAILHTCHSSTSCSPRSATTAHKLSVYCACKKQICRYTLCVAQVVPPCRRAGWGWKGDLPTYHALQHWLPFHPLEMERQSMLCGKKRRTCKGDPVLLGWGWKGKGLHG